MDEKLKQRLVGAAVIVALAAIFIPMILEGPDDDLGPVGSNLPPAPQYRVGDRVEPLVLPPPPAAEAGADPPGEAETAPGPTGVPQTAETAETATPAGPEPGPPPPEPEPEPAPAAVAGPAPAPAASAPSAASPQGRGWVVQVASFSRQANAERLRDRLKTRGYDAFVEPASTASGSTWRVRVGPLAERAAAEKLRGEIAAAFDLQGLVAEYP